MCTTQNTPKKNEPYKILLDLGIQRDHLISNRWFEPVIVNKNEKRTCRIVDFAVLVDHSESEKRDNYLDLSRELKKNENDGDTNYN